MKIARTYYVIGVDPGLSGAICAISDCDGFRTIDVYDMPTLSFTVGGKVRRRVDLPALASLAAALAAGSPDAALLEDVSGRPPGKSGAQSGQFQQGWNACAPAMALVAAGIVFEQVTPNVWKKKLGVPKEKDGARLKASTLIPEGRALWQRAKDDGRAEAALIALYQLKKLKGELG